MSCDTKNKLPVVSTRTHASALCMLHPSSSLDMPCCRTDCHAAAVAQTPPPHCCFGSHVKAQWSPQKKVVLSGWNGLHSAASARHLGGGRGTWSKGSGSAAAVPADGRERVSNDK